jgi:predicted regulator of Ras-like GTPase activity (Roadblock/LC7/MglB family)
MMIELVHSLRRVCNHLDDVRGIALVGADGLIVEEIKQDPLLDLAALAAELSVMLKSLGDTVRAGSLGRMENFQVETTGGIMIVAGVGADYFLMLVLRPGGNSGRGRFYVQLEAERLDGEV